MNQFRFAVGTPKGQRSTVWKAWTTGGEAYLQSRMMGSSTKVSLHSDGQCQWSMTSEWYGKNRPGEKNAGRHITRWQRPKITDDTAALAFRVIIPISELRIIEDSQEELANVHWIPSPGQEQAQVVECYLTPALAGRNLDFPYSHLASLELSDSKLFVLLSHSEPVTSAQISQLDFLRNRAQEQLARMSKPLKPEFRGVGFTKGDKGERGMIEFVPAGGNGSLS